MDKNLIKDPLYMEIYASLIVCNEQKKANESFNLSIENLEKRLANLEKIFHNRREDIHKDCFDKIVISYLEFKGFKTKNFKNLYMSINQVLYDYELKKSNSYYGYFDGTYNLEKEANSFLPKNLDFYDMFNDLLKTEFDDIDIDDVDLLDDDVDNEDFEIDEEATRILHLEQRRSSRFSFILHAFWNTRFKKLKKFHINYARYKDYIINSLEDENAYSNRFDYYDLKSLKIHKDIKLYDLYKQKLDEYSILYDNYKNQVETIHQKIDFEKTKHNEYSKKIDCVFKTLVIIPMHYSNNLDAVKKMMFLYINKRADNIKELINLYEETEWRGSLLDSVNSLSDTINKNTQLLINELQDLGGKLDELKIEMRKQTIMTLDAIFNLTNTVANSKVSFETKVDVNIS